MDLSNWANSGQFHLKDNLNLKKTRSIASSRAESRMSYRSKSSKIDRRKDKKAALLERLEYDAKMTQISRKAPKNRQKLMEKLNQQPRPCSSGSQADIALHKMEQVRAKKLAERKAQKEIEQKKADKIAKKFALRNARNVQGNDDMGLDCSNEKVDGEKNEPEIIQNDKVSTGAFSSFKVPDSQTTLAYLKNISKPAVKNRNRKGSTKKMQQAMVSHVLKMQEKSKGSGFV